MHPSIHILQEVIRLAEGEFKLLELEDADGLTESAEKRDSMLKAAWENKAGCDEGDFVNLLVTIQALQRKLDTIAEEKLAEARSALNSHKKSRSAILGYCKIGAGYGKKPHKIFTKFS